MSSSDREFERELPVVDDQASIPNVVDEGTTYDVTGTPITPGAEAPSGSVNNGELIPPPPPGTEETSPRWFNISPLRPLKRLAPKTKFRFKRNRSLATVAAGIAIAGGIALSLPFIWLQFNKLPDIRLLETYAPVQSVRIFDAHDKLAAVVSGDEDRRPIKLSQVSPNMQLAMIGAEDHEFYHHGGINPSSIFRAMIVNLKAGRIVEGGSTITQQLVKNLFFPGEQRTFNRKIKEFFLANQVAHKYQKNKILEMYLNQIYFGNQAYGIESAAERYFNKHASQLTMGESTFLAGMVRAPSYLSNPDHRDRAFARQHQVIDQMVDYGMLTKAQGDSAKGEKLTFRKYVSPFQKYPFYVSFVMDQLREHYGEQELQHGLNVYTCLDTQAQDAAEKALNDGIAHAPRGVTQGATVSVRVADGSVIALVGGAGKFEEHQWNRAVEPHTMGSAFKPFVYLTGFLRGLTPNSIVLDTPFSAPSGGHYYSPRNFDNGFMGPLTVKTALTQSRNICAVRIAYFCGIKNVINTAHLAGITSKLDPYLPTAIGACAASPLDMAGAYSTIARGGVYLTPHLVRRITAPDGKLVYQYDEKPRKVFDSNAVAELVDCMQNVVQHGTGIYAQLPGRPVAGKTGTADKSKDIWFCGFTPDVCTTFWGGNDHNKGIANRAVTGGMVMAGMFKKYMLAYYATHPTPPGSFMAPSKDIGIALDTKDASKAPGAGITPVDAKVADKDKQSADDKKTATSKTDNKNGDKSANDGSATSDNAAAAGDDSKSTADNAKVAGDNSDSATAPNKARSKRSHKLIADRAPKAAESTDEKAAQPKAEEPPAVEKVEPKAEATAEKAEKATETAPEPAPPAPSKTAPEPRAAAPHQMTRNVLVPIGGGRALLYRVPIRSAPQAAPAPAPAPVSAPAGDDGE